MNYFEYNTKKLQPKVKTQYHKPERRDLRNETDANRELRDTIRFIAACRTL